MQGFLPVGCTTRRPVQATPRVGPASCAPTRVAHHHQAPVQRLVHRHKDEVLGKEVHILRGGQQAAAAAEHGTGEKAHCRRFCMQSHLFRNSPAADARNSPAVHAAAPQPSTVHTGQTARRPSPSPPSRPTAPTHPPTPPTHLGPLFDLLVVAQRLQLLPLGLDLLGIRLDILRQGAACRVSRQGTASCTGHVMSWLPLLGTRWQKRHTPHQAQAGTKAERGSRQQQKLGDIVDCCLVGRPHPTLL